MFRFKKARDHTCPSLSGHAHEHPLHNGHPGCCALLPSPTLVPSLPTDRSVRVPTCPPRQHAPAVCSECGRAESGVGVLLMAWHHSQPDALAPLNEVAGRAMGGLCERCAATAAVALAGGGLRGGVGQVERGGWEMEASIGRTVCRSTREISRASSLHVPLFTIMHMCKSTGVCASVHVWVRARACVCDTRCVHA